MRVRPLKPSDIPFIQKIHADSGFAYEFPDLDGTLIEAVHVVEDDDGNPVAICAAERLVQLYLFMAEDGHPASKLHAIRLLHTSLMRELREKGYNSAEAFLPPEIEKRFGKRLARTFSWLQNWKSFCIHF